MDCDGGGISVFEVDLYVIGGEFSEIVHKTAKAQLTEILFYPLSEGFPSMTGLVTGGNEG